MPNIRHKLGEDTVIVTIHPDFLACIEDEPSPFKQGRVVLPPGIGPAVHESVAIKCFIAEGFRAIIARHPGMSSESICHEVVAQFIRNNWPDNNLMQTENIHCSHFEQQYKYLTLNKPVRKK